MLRFVKMMRVIRLSLKTVLTKSPSSSHLQSEADLSVPMEIKGSNCGDKNSYIEKFTELDQVYWEI